MIKSRTTVRPPFVTGVLRVAGTPSNTMHSGYVEQSVMTGEGHWGWPNPPGARNVGGEFLLKKNTVKLGSTGGRADLSGGTDWHGNVYSNVPAQSFPTVIPVGGAWGAEAWNKMRPAQPSFEGLNAIWELRELPQMLRQRFTPDLKGASNYWLALQFGWKPLLRDIRNFVSTQRGAQKYVKQLLRDNGRPVRRSVNLYDNTTSTYHGTAPGGMSPQLANTFYHMRPYTSAITEVTDEVWAAARFRYWLPRGPRDVWWKRRMLASIYGLNPTPSVVFNAIPWTWCVDWFTGIGHLVKSLDTGVAERLAADYFYIMRRTETKLTYESNCVFRVAPNGQGSVPCSASSSSSKITKARSIGHPFGWGTTPSSLSPMQWSILGALGLSRL